MLEINVKKTILAFVILALVWICAIQTVSITEYKAAIDVYKKAIEAYKNTTRR